MRKFKNVILLSIIIFLGLNIKSEAMDRYAVFPRNNFSRGMAVMSAYQKPYAMNFEIWKPMGLPSGWYATFDGFPVAQISENRWVYGQLEYNGAIRPTDILVGSVIPSEVPGLLRVAFVWGNERFFNDSEFLKIREYMCNRMGWLNDGTISTVIAWNIYKPHVWIWLGNRWRRFTPNSGEYAWEMLKRLSPMLNEELRKSGMFYLPGEPYEIADLARQWGFIWLGKVTFSELRNYKDSGGSEHSYSMREHSTSTSSNNDNPKQENNGSQWDID